MFSCLSNGRDAVTSSRLDGSTHRPQRPTPNPQKPGAPDGGAAAHDPVLTLKAMQKFAEKYCEITDTYFCSDLEIAATVVKGG